MEEGYRPELEKTDESEFPQGKTIEVNSGH